MGLWLWSNWYNNLSVRTIVTLEESTFSVIRRTIDVSFLLWIWYLHGFMRCNCGPTKVNYASQVLYCNAVTRSRITLLGTAKYVVRWTDWKYDLQHLSYTDIWYQYFVHFLMIRHDQIFTMERTCKLRIEMRATIVDKRSPRRPGIFLSHEIRTLLSKTKLTFVHQGVPVTGMKEIVSSQAPKVMYVNSVEFLMKANSTRIAKSFSSVFWMPRTLLEFQNLKLLIESCIRLQIDFL